MGLANRHYLFPEDGSLQRVPRRVVTGLALGEDSIPAYANTRQRVGQFLVESEDGKAVSILDAIGTFWEFDEHGKIDHALRRTAGEWLAFAFSTDSRRTVDRSRPVVDLTPELRRNRLHDRHRWDISIEDLDRVAADIWPGIHGPAPEVSSLKGRLPKKPPLSYEARNALAEIGKHVDRILYEIEKLNEHGCRGLEFEAHRTASYEHPALWKGVAEQVKLKRQIHAAYRTGKGEWYAVIEAFQDDGPMVSKNSASAHEKCASQKEAIEAGKRLMAEKADWLRSDVRVELSICSALEWQPEEE